MPRCRGSRYHRICDTTPPNTSINSGPSGPTTSTAASFSFSSSELGSSFACKLDAGSWGACGSPKGYSELGLGAHTFSVRATDAAANTDPSPASWSWTVEAPPDTTPPETTITAQPPANTSETAASFSFSSSELGSSFACKLDAGSWGSCGSPKGYSGLGLGAHTFSVRATDAAANTDPSPASWSWTVEAPPDTTPPETTITAQPPANTSETAASFSFSSSELGSSFACKLDAGSWGACGSPKGYSELGLGAHTFSVRATDAAANTDPSPASWSWTVEAPSPPNNSANAVWSTPPDTQVAIPATLDGTASTGGPPLTCTWSFENEDGSTIWQTREGCSIDFTFESSGMKHVRLIVQSGDGTSDSNKQSFNVAPTSETEIPPGPDTTPPETTITAQPPANTSETAASFSFSSSELGSSFACKLDAGSWGSCGSPKGYSGLGLGAHTFSVRATDAAANTDPSPASWSWTVEAPPDTTPPETTITAQPPANTSETAASFSFSSSELGSSFACKLDAGSWGACGSPKGYSGLGLGAHTFSVRATDAAANTDPSPASWSWTVEAPPDTTPPETTITAQPPANTSETAASFSFSSSELGSSFACKLDAGSWGSCGSPKGYSGLGLGAHTFSVRATDAAANTDPSPASWSWTVEAPPDTTPPETTITAQPPANTSETAASFSFSSSELGSSFACKLDAGSWGACGSPKGYSGLGLGAHTFSVRATDAAANTDPSPASWSWTVQSPSPPPPSGCVAGATQATTASQVRSAVQSSNNVCVVASVGNVDLDSLGSRSVVVSTENGGSMGAISIDSTTDLTIQNARFRSVEMRGADRTRLIGNVIGGTQANRVYDQLIFMPDANKDVVIEGNDIGWTIADDSGNTGYGCRCYGNISGLRFVGNKVHDLAADGFQLGGNGSDILIDRNEIGPVGANPSSSEHSDNIQIVSNGPNLRITNNWIHHQGYYEGQVVANAGSTYIHGGTSNSLLFENNLIEVARGRTEICGLGTGGTSRSNITIRRNTWVDGGQTFNSFPGFEWDCSSGSGNTVERNIAVDPDGGFAGSQSAATFSANLFGQPSLVTLDANRNCTSSNCNPSGQEAIGYRKPSGVDW